MQSHDSLSGYLPRSLVKINDIYTLCCQAGEVILSIYNSDNLGVQFKKDGSPVTSADFAAHNVIKQALERLTPGWPVLSEEESDIPFSERKHWTTYWLVDPLDGTREFVNHSDEFTVNIALIHEHKSIFGFVYMPVQGVTYFGGTAVGGAWRMIANGEPETIAVRPAFKGGVLRVAVSRHISEEKMPDIFTALHAEFAEVHLIELAGAAKGCLVADGSIDFYPRPGFTCEWDTAAFQAVVEAAGGKVCTQQFVPLEYNRKENLNNVGFYVIGDTTIDWASILQSVKS